MTGKKLHQLLLELNATRKKELTVLCESNSDKRYIIFQELLQESFSDPEEMNICIRDAIERVWPSSTNSEKQVKHRRLQHYFCSIIEQQLLGALLQNNNSIRNVLLARSLEKSGNLYLLNHYYDQAYKKSVEEEDALFQLIGIKGKIRMKYTSHAEKELKEALELNNDFIRVLQNANEQKIAEYYDHVSNIYLEHNALIQTDRQKYIDEINVHLQQLSSTLSRASLYVSLAKFHYDSSELADYFAQAKNILSNVEERNNEFYVLERKARFLELRLTFFHGEDLETLVKITDDILCQSSEFSIMNNNTLFYKILFELLLDRTDAAMQLLNQNEVYFKGDGKLPEHFLRGFTCMKMGDYRMALQLLQPMMYGSNYFLVVFSRLLVIKIQILRGQGAWSKSLVDSTRRYLKFNSGNPLGHEASSYVLNELNRQRSSRKNGAEPEAPVLTALHRFILEANEVN